MSPHNDASSPSGSYTAGFNRFPFRASADAAGAALSVPGSGFTADSSLSSSFESATADGPEEREPSGLSRPVRRRPALVPGVYVPTMCFFETDTEDLDIDMIASHAVRLAQAGVTGLATQGSNGEAVHLSHAERALVTRTTRRALDAAGFSRMPLIVGCGAQSTRETLDYCREAWAAGGDYALVLPPAYYAPLFASGAPGVARDTIIDFFVAVANKSPLPLIIYNYPGAVNGMDMSSDVIAYLSKHPNIVGVKLTCGNTGKLSRVVAATRKRAASTTTATAGGIGTSEEDPNAPPFLVLAGSADFTIQSLAVGGHGILAGLANIAPKACLRTMELFRQGRLAEAQDMQEIVARGDWTAIQGGVVGVKAGLEAWEHYGGFARSPLPHPTPEQNKKWKEGFRELVTLENSL